MTLSDYAKKTAGRVCVACGKLLPPPITIEYYDHSAGWEVDEFLERQWLYITCPACRYQNALWKLGIQGSTNSAHERIAQERDAFYRHLYN